MFAKLVELAFIGCAALGVYGFVTAAKDSETRRSCTSLCALQPDYAARNRLAPDFELPSINGNKVRLSSYRGKVVILNFWTKTCRPCLEEMPSIADLAKALKAHPNVALVTITTDEDAKDARDTMKSVLGGGDPPFEVLIDADSKIVGDKYGTKLFPETWFIDGQGVIRARFDGGRSWASPMIIDLAQSLSNPVQCEVAFDARKPQGPQASLCGEFTPDSE
ncbi:MAG TPA: TlpA disulfide reductase family protein [Polyangiaceae bacterium]|nr:TlpA disulfide reductase family protein [Polyangiaceae bacterium]